MVTVKDVSEAIKCLNKGKSDGDSGLKTDHLIYAPVRIHVLISFLFSSMLLHGYMPGEYLKSNIIPIPKDNKMDLSNSENYRGIALNSPLCKLFEVLIAQKCSTYFSTLPLQFGFKEKHSTIMSACVLKQVVSHYVSHDSRVYCCFLDATKAFDRLKFDKLFLILLERNVPSVYIRILLDMYTRQNICVSWQGHKSNFFTAYNGVKQGGVISPLLFNLYIDILLKPLEAKGIGCYMGNIFMSWICR